MSWSLGNDSILSTCFARECFGGLAGLLQGLTIKKSVIVFKFNKKGKNKRKKKKIILLCTEYAPGLLGYQYLGSRSGSVIFLLNL